MTDNRFDREPAAADETVLERTVKSFLADNEPKPPLTASLRKASYIGAPACFALEQALWTVAQAFGCYRFNGPPSGIYLVGSAMERADWRDVDVRLIMDDAEFERLFPGVSAHHGSWEHDPRWVLLTVAISQWLSSQTGLPVDFQFQPQTFANTHHAKPRNAAGMRIAK